MSKSKIAKRAKLPKTELLRRRRLGHLKRLLRDRCGPVLPNDDAGLEYLIELLLPISLGPSETVHWGPVDRMRRAIEVWAPWMSEDEARDLRRAIMAMPRSERWPSQRELGQRLRVTYAEREKHRLWAIDPYNVSKVAMALFRKRKKRRRNRDRRIAQGAETRAEYLAKNTKSKDQPWLKQGISRRTYYRRLKQEQPRGTGPSQINLTKTELALVPRQDLSAKASSSLHPASTATPSGCPSTRAWLTGTCVTAGSSQEAA